MTMTALGALDARLDLNLSPGWLLAVQADAHTVHMVSAEKKPELPERRRRPIASASGWRVPTPFLVGEGMSLAPTVEAGYAMTAATPRLAWGSTRAAGCGLSPRPIGLMVDARGHAVLSNFASDAQTGDAAGALVNGASAA